jgi:hypothetical protein
MRGIVQRLWFRDAAHPVRMDDDPTTAAEAARNSRLLILWLQLHFSGHLDFIVHLHKKESYLL